MESKFIKAQNKKLHYKTHLNQNEASKPVVIFIHGAVPATQHTEFWTPIVPIITKKCQPIFLDGYGHGQSDKPDADEVVNFDIILSIYKKFITKIIQTENIEDFIIIGRSLGGYVTHSLAKEFEKNLLGIGLIAPAGASKVPETLKGWTKLVSVLWDTEDPVVGFESYANIEATVKQSKLFSIGEKGSYSTYKVFDRNKTTKPSHMPELDYPVAFEGFLDSLLI